MRSKNWQMESVATYSLISSARICSSVWSTLMTSSIRRWMFCANSDSIVFLLARFHRLIDLRAIVVFGVFNPHEFQSRGSVQNPRVEQHTRNVYKPHHLL